MSSRFAVVFLASLTLLSSFVARAEEDLQEKAKRQARSVHLWHGPIVKDAESVVGTVKVTETQPSSYYMTIGFTGGYSGIQDVRGGKWMIFSIWDAVDFEHTKVTDPAEREKLSALVVYTAEDVEIVRFGGEGTGMRTMRKIDWEVNRPVRIRIDTEDYKDDRTLYTCSWYNFSTGEWVRMSAIAMPNHGKGRQYLKGVYSFIEDFLGNYKSAEVSRRAEFYDFASRAAGSKIWVPVEEAYFAGDRNPSMRVDGGRAGGKGAFFLQTGGATTNVHTKIMSTIR